MEVDNKIATSFDLLEAFNGIYEEELSKLPYRLNVFDYMQANENAHSRLLVKLLKYKPALKSFIQYLNRIEEKSEQGGDAKPGFNFDISLIKKPVITAESMRIDALIREKGKYAIIIENKIHGAVEQEGQIGRYISKCKANYCSKEQIYILYLTRETEQPSDQTWGAENKDEFQSRFLCLSYSGDILNWLREYEGSLTKNVDHLVKSALIQYIDYLELLTNKKGVNNIMKENIKDSLIKTLEFGTSAQENLAIVTGKINELGKLDQQLKEIQESLYFPIIDEVHQLLKMDSEIDNADIIPVRKIEGMYATGIRINLAGDEYAFLLGKQTYNIFTCLFPYPTNSAKKVLNETIVKYFQERKYYQGTTSYFYKYVPSMDRSWEELMSCILHLRTCKL